MLREFALDLRAAQGFGFLLEVLAVVGLSSSVTSLAYARRLPRLARVAALVSLVIGALSCALGTVGFATLREQSSAATAANTALTSSALERIRRTGDVDAQRLAELGVFAAALPLAGAFVVLQRIRRRAPRAIDLICGVAGACALIAWGIPPRGRQLDRREWLLLDAREDLARNDMAAACVPLRDLRAAGTARPETGRGPFAPERADMTPSEILALVPDGNAMVDRCFDDEAERYSDLGQFLLDAEGFGWTTPERRARAIELFSRRVPPPNQPAETNAGSAALISTSTTSGAEKSAAQALFFRLEDQMIACYRRALALDPTLYGTLQITISLRGGHADDITVNGTLPPEARQCAAREFRRGGYYELASISSRITLNVALEP